MLIRCGRCQAVFSIQEGLAGPVQRAFRVECGRCQAVFDAQSGQLPEAPRTPPPRRIPTPVPLQRPVTVALPAGPQLAVERHASPEEMADMGPLRPAIYGPVARQNPLTLDFRRRRHHHHLGCTCRHPRHYLRTAQAP